MKVGVRKRSYKKSFSAMTSGRYKRAMKRAVNPFYGRKGVGFLKILQNQYAGWLIGD